MTALKSHMSNIRMNNVRLILNIEKKQKCYNEYNTTHTHCCTMYMLCYTDLGQNFTPGMNCLNQ